MFYKNIRILNQGSNVIRVKIAMNITLLQF